MRCARTVAERAVCALAGAVTAWITVSAVGPPAIATAQDGVAVAPAEAGGCPGLFVLGVQGTGQSSPDSPVAADTGMLAMVLGPLTEPGSEPAVGRAYVPYPAGFGGALPDADVTPYSASASEGLGRLRDMAVEVTERCPRTQLAMIGYSQGAHVVSMLAREIGAGVAPVPADRVAAVALLADPTRAPGAAVFPGRPGQNRPDPAPGTTGAELAALPEFPQAPAPGGGIGPLRDIAPDFGALTGRVASLCLPGDLACDAPAHAPLLHMAVNIIGQAELVPADPVAALSSIADGFTATLGRTATAVVTHDLRGYSLGTLRLTPAEPLSVRLAEAADPRSNSEPQEREALLKLGTTVLNTLLAILGIALEPAEVAAIATAPDPLTGLERTATAIVAASRRPLPHRTVFNLVTETFDTLGQLSAENAELLDPLLWLRYTDTVRKHGDYFHTAYTPDGRPAAGLVLEWFTAVAADLARNRLPDPASQQRVPALPARADPGAGPALIPLPSPQWPRPAPGVRDIASAPQPYAVADTDRRSPYGLGSYLLGLVFLAAVSACACGAIRVAHRVRDVRSPLWSRGPAALRNVLPAGVGRRSRKRPARPAPRATRGSRAPARSRSPGSGVKRGG